jgi:hypothetical protein
MRSRQKFLQILLLLTLGLGPISAASAQKAQPRTDSGRARGYAFVSPNTRENLTLVEAQAALKSAEEQRLIDEARYVACRLRKSIGVAKAIGSWSDGAEHSTVVQATTNEPTLRYAGSWLGKFARQKAILYFREDPSGEARMHILVLPPNRRDIASIAAELDSDGIENRTLVPQTKSILVYIVDLKNELRSKILIAARGLRARISSLRGSGEFIGDDDRDKAQTVFAQEILKYEAGNRHARRRCRKRIKSLDLRVWNDRLRKSFDTRSCLGLFSLQSST